MPEEFTGRIADLRAWMLLHRVRDLAFYLQDRICSEHGISLEQYTVLAAIKYLDPPVLIGDVARWMGNKGNTTSLLTDRMVQAGLLERFRDLPDRRQARLTLTRKAEEAFARATPALWGFVKSTMSSLSDDERTTLVHLLEEVRATELQNYTPENDIRISGGYENSDLSRLVKRLGKPARSSSA